MLCARLYCGAINKWACAVNEKRLLWTYYVESLVQIWAITSELPAFVHLSNDIIAFSVTIKQLIQLRRKRAIIAIGVTFQWIIGKYLHQTDIYMVNNAAAYKVEDNCSCMLAQAEARHAILFIHELSRNRRIWVRWLFATERTISVAVAEVQTCWLQSNY